MSKSEWEPEKSSINASASFSDPGLSQLRKQIKNIMIPLLIKVFHLRLEVQQTKAPPSRLHSKEPKPALTELIDQLKKLDEDLAILQGWSQSCRSQIEKVLSEAEQGSQPPTNHIQAEGKGNPAVEKSFQKAVKPISQPSTQIKRPWWRRVLHLS